MKMTKRGFSLLGFIALVLAIGISASIAFPALKRTFIRIRTAEVWPELEAMNEALVTQRTRDGADPYAIYAFEELPVVFKKEDGKAAMGYQLDRKHFTYFIREDAYARPRETGNKPDILLNITRQGKHACAPYTDKGVEYCKAAVGAKMGAGCVNSPKVCYVE